MKNRSAVAAPGVSVKENDTARCPEGIVTVAGTLLQVPAGGRSVEIRLSVCARRVKTSSLVVATFTPRKSSTCVVVASPVSAGMSNGCTYARVRGVLEVRLSTKLKFGARRASSSLMMTTVLVTCPSTKSCPRRGGSSIIVKDSALSMLLSSTERTETMVRVSPLRILKVPPVRS